MLSLKMLNEQGNVEEVRLQLEQVCIDVHGDFELLDGTVRGVFLGSELLRALLAMI